MAYELLEKIFHKYPDRYEEIYQSRISSESTYKLPIHINKFPAFLILTPELFVLNNTIYQLSAKFSELLSKKILKATSNKMHSFDFSKNKFLENCLINELIQTNDIEGIKSTRKDILDAIDANLKNDKKVRFQGMVNKYQMIINDEKLDFMSCTKIRKLYDEIVLTELEKEDLPDGQIFRKSTVVVSNGIKSVHDGLFPEMTIIEAMENAIQILNDGKLPMIVRIAIFHYLIGYIHPFYDGNGRLSRFISSYLLKEELNVFVALKLSYTIKKFKKEYYKAFDISNDFRNRGDLTYFIQTFLDFVFDACKTTLEDFFYSFDKILSYIEIIYNSNLNNFLKQILIVFAQVYGASNNEIYFDELLELTQTNETTLREKLKLLIDDGFVERRKEGKRYVYSLIVNQLEQFR